MLISLQYLRGSLLLQRACISFTVISNYLSSQQHLQASHCHLIFGFIVQVLVDLIQVMYGETGTSPFETHSKTMSCAVICLLAYCMAYGMELRFASRTAHSSIYAHAMALFGSLALASLASLFFPDSIRWLLYLIYIVSWMAHIFYTLLCKCHRIGSWMAHIFYTLLRRCPRTHGSDAANLSVPTLQPDRQQNRLPI